MNEITCRFNRGGATLVELLVALPILAIGLGAAAAFIVSSSSHLGAGEARLQATIQGIAVMDSLRLLVGHDPIQPPGAGGPGGDEPPGGAFPAEGVRPAAHASMLWRWDGCCRLEVELDGGHSGGGRVIQGPGWVLLPGGATGAGDVEGATAGDSAAGPEPTGGPNPLEVGS